MLLPGRRRCRRRRACPTSSAAGATSSTGCRACCSRGCPPHTRSPTRTWMCRAKQKNKQDQSSCSRGLDGSERERKIMVFRATAGRRSSRRGPSAQARWRLWIDLQAWRALTTGRSYQAGAAAPSRTPPSRTALDARRCRRAASSGGGPTAPSCWRGLRMGARRLGVPGMHNQHVGTGLDRVRSNRHGATVTQTIAD